MSDNNGSMMLVVGGISLMSSSLFIPILFALAFYVYKVYIKNDAFVTADWTDERMLVPPEAREDRDDDCVYFYDYSKEWTSGGGRDGAIKASSKWCIPDGLNVPTPIWEANKIHGDGIGHNQVNYIRLGKNVNLNVWDNYTTEDGFKGSGNESRYLGRNYGLGKLIRLNKDVKEDDLDVFQIDKA